MDMGFTTAILAAGGLFLIALLTGVWKYQAMVGSTTGEAHPYIDIAHRSSLLYAFASLFMAELATLSLLPEALELLALGCLLFYFYISVLSYCVRGWRKDTDNQIRDLKPSGKIFMWSLVVGEIGGFLVLFGGAAAALVG